MRKLRQFITLAGLTSLEAIRQPICLLLATTCVVLTGLVPMLTMHQFGEQGRLARDSGLALHFVFGLLISGYIASTSLNREMKSGTASAVLSKPVSRVMFFLSKFAGIVFVIILFSLCATISTLLSERIAEKFQTSGTAYGYVTDWRTGIILLCTPFAAYLLAGFLNYKIKTPFESTAFALLLLSLIGIVIASCFYERSGHASSFTFIFQWSIINASVLITIALLIISAIAISLSTKLETIPTMSITSAIFLIGLISDYAFGRPMMEGNLLCGFLFGVSPNFQHFWLSDAISDGGVIPSDYVLSAARYAAVYSAGILCLGVLSFRQSDMT
ncbi:hypothetical protein BVX94_02580 [bacterium B17]|nr:hypothetical protein BVX94_02580 [bacterium B17]